jgi:hypothetical protein
MNSLTRGYLAGLGRQMHLWPVEEKEILHELQAHLEDKTNELMENGISSDEALSHALVDLGDANNIAQSLYEVHSRGSWYQTLLGILPHILLSLMFALHLWTSLVWVTSMLVVAMVISVFGWRMGRPRWTYPWLGYCLLVPMVSWGLAMSSVGYGAWSVVTSGSLPLGVPIYLASFVYVAFSLWLVIRYVSKVVRPDWVMASLAFLPVPFLAYWFYYFYSRGEALRTTGQSLEQVDSSAAIVFVVLAVATALFFRIGRRVVRVALLVITAPSMVVLAWLSYQGGPGYMAVFLFAAISLAVLLSPALLDLKGNHTERAGLSDLGDSQADQQMLSTEQTSGSSKS